MFFSPPGSGNVICLDILRALRREPESTGALLEELHRASPAAEDAQKESPNCYVEILKEVLFWDGL